jgi:hypothetical protein
MTESEQQTLPRQMQRADIAAGIAKDAQENPTGLDVVSVGNTFAGEVGGEQYLQLSHRPAQSRGRRFRGAPYHCCPRSRCPAHTNQSGIDHGARNSAACRFSVTS